MPFRACASFPSFAIFLCDVAVVTGSTHISTVDRSPNTTTSGCAGGPHTTLEALVQDIADRAEQLHDAPDVTVAMELAVQVLNASLTLHFAVPSLPSVRCALDKVFVHLCMPGT